MELNEYSQHGLVWKYPKWCTFTADNTLQQLDLVSLKKKEEEKKKKKKLLTAKPK